MKNKWIFFVASRYIFKGRSNSPVLAVLGIATGVLALIVIISVMNGFQLGFIENILEISSYHIRIENFDKTNTDTLIKKINEVNGVKAAVPFNEIQAIARGRRTGQSTIIVRGLRDDTPYLDLTMAKKLNFEEGSFNLEYSNSILLGSELARKLGVFAGDEITMFSISGMFAGNDSSNDGEDSGIEKFIVEGIFRTGYYEYDSTWAFINIDNDTFKLNESNEIIGIKLNNRFNDKLVMERIKKTLWSDFEFENIKLSSWRDYNRSFFSALRTEKLFMFILVGLIFIVVGLNIFQAQRRSVLQRREEIGLLRAIGGAKNSVRFVFVLDGAIIGLTGSLIGLFLGISIASNIQGFFTAIENGVNKIIGFINSVSAFFGAVWIDDFAVFSPTIFYIKEIPSRILPLEVTIIFMFGLLSSLLASWFASRKIIKIQPAEVLRYE